jgi:hypothetical protein
MAAMLNIDTSRSYKTENNLLAALQRFNLSNRMPLIVRNRKGDWTAVFGLDNAQPNGDLTFAARHGFITIS